MHEGKFIHDGELDREGFCAVVLADVRHHWEDVTTPEGDPLPRAYFYRDAGVAVYEIPLEFFLNSDTTGELFDVLREIAMRGNVTRLAVANVMYAAPNPIAEEDMTPEQRSRHNRGLTPDGVAIRDRADKFELASIVVLDADCASSVAAQITRSDTDPPTLGEWDEITQLQGRMADIAKSMPR